MRKFADLLPSSSRSAATTTNQPATVAAKALEVNAPTGAEGSVSVRQIENGFVVQQSSYAGGKYESKETFFAKPPVIKVTG